MDFSAFQRPGPLRLDSTNLEAEWKSFQQKFELFLIASGSEEKPDATRVAMLLNLAGDEALKLYNTFQYDNPENAKNYDTVVGKFRSYCLPRKNVVYERFQFWQLTQQPGESVDSFSTTLRVKAASCEFETQTDSMIRDRIVLGCPNRQTQERLLREADLTLQKALDICRASESTREQIQCISGESAAVNAVREKPVNRTASVRRPFNSDTNTSCGNCGTVHPPKSCPAFGRQCNACSKPNHFAAQCRSSGSARGKSRPQRHMSSSSVHDVSMAEITQLDHLRISSCTLNNREDTSWYRQFDIQGTQINCKLDSGAEANVMSAAVFSLVKNPPTLRSTSVVLTAYSNTVMKPIGIATLCLKFRGQAHPVEFLIVKHRAATLIGLPTCVKLDILRQVDGVSLETTSTLIAEYADVFDGLGCFPGEHHITTDTSVSPVIHAPRRVPLSLQPKLKQQLDRMVKAGVLSKRDEPTDWVNSLLLVEKKDGSLRLCLDPRDLNQAIKREHYAIPTSDDVTARLHGKNLFTIIDMKDGFWQLKLDEESSKLCTFNTPFGRYSFARLPFGISSAPEVFQKRNTEVFGDIPNAHVVFDDLIIAASNEKEHDDTLRQVLERARNYNLRFNKDKIQFKVSQVRYLGNILSPEGISADPDKVRAIVEMQHPSDKKDLLRFLGMLTYLSKFMPNFSSETQPLRALLKKDMPWSWTQHHDSTFQALKKQIASTPVLRFFDISKPAVIQTDASSMGLGSCLLQEGRPIAYASRALTDAETRYAQIEKELLAIVFACEKFSQYIYGQRTLVQSDHKPLESIFRKSISTTTPRLQRMLLRLLKYQLQIEYVPGKNMHIADTLSRAYLTASPSALDRELSEDIEVTVHTLLHNAPISDRMLSIFRAAVQKDPELMQLRELLQSDTHVDKMALSHELKTYAKVLSDIYEAEGVLFLNQKIIVPHALRSDMLLRIHEGHLGMDKCKAMARTTLYWPGMARDIENLVARCGICNAYHRKQQQEPLLPHPVPERPWQKVGADIFTLYGRDYLLVVDYFSKFPEICHLESKTASSVVVKIKSIFARHGIPDELVADNMPFNSGAMKIFAEEWNFVVTTTSPHYAQANGQAERAIQTIKKLLKKAEESGTDPNIALLQYRNAPIADLNVSPSQLLMSRVLRTKLPVSSEVLYPMVVDGRQQLQARQDRQKRYYDRSTKGLPALNPGDVVRVRHNNEWVRGVVNSKHHTPRSYNVVTENASTLRRNRRDLIRTVEDPPTLSHPPADEFRLTTSRPPSDQPAVTAPSSQTGSPTASSSSEQPPNPPPLEPQSNQTTPNIEEGYRTRSGRLVKARVRFQDQY